MFHENLPHAAIILMVFVIPCDLTLVDVQPSLGHVSHAPLRLLSDKGAEVMDKRSFIRDLKVTDTAVTLLETKHQSEQNPFTTKTISPNIQVYTAFQKSVR